MDKKTYNPSDEEEYKFHEPESEPHSTATHTVASSHAFERINRQHIIFGVIFIFLVYGAYKLLNQLFHTAFTKLQTVEKIQQVIPKQNATINPHVNEEVATDRLAHLAQGQAEVQSAVHSLDSQISDVQTSLQSLNTQLTQVNDELQDLHTNQELLMQKQTKPVKKDEKKKEAPKAIYYVRAMIPGRVWFTAQDGSMLTLGVGDTLAGYGSIDSIDPEQGIVTLSSGAVIGYNPNDR
jgi:hypothetical protein